MNRDGTSARLISGELDRDVEEPMWSQDGGGIYLQYDDQGNTKIGFITLDGKLRTLAQDLGGVSHGRPYSSGSFSVSKDGRFAYTQSRPEYPADVAVGQKGAGEVKRVTRLNDDLFGFKQLGATEQIRFESSFDKRRVQGWVVKPPGFDAQKKYPLILEIHGGAFADYSRPVTSGNQLFSPAGVLGCCF